MKKDSAVMEPQKSPTSRQVPRYNVILLDDDHHTFEYVIDMMKAIFGFPIEQGFKIATTVNNTGKAICLTTTKEHAELKRDQIQSFGKDKAIAQCKGSMSAKVEPF